MEKPANPVENLRERIGIFFTQIPSASEKTGQTVDNFPKTVEKNGRNRADLGKMAVKIVERKPPYVDNRRYSVDNRRSWWKLFSIVAILTGNP